jgi:hypothetical protein
LTRTKAWRLSLATILGFGWLFITPAYSDDPLSIASERIAELNSNLDNLTDKSKTQELISLAEDKYEDAVDARDNKISSEEEYNQAFGKYLEFDNSLDLNGADEFQVAQKNEDIFISSKYYLFFFLISCLFSFIDQYMSF